MTKSRLLAAAIMLSAATATPVFAQPAIQEPGAYAFHHPYGDLGYGPAPSADAMASVRPGDSMAQLRSATMSPPLHVRRPLSVKRY